MPRPAAHPLTRRQALQAALAMAAAPMSARAASWPSRPVTMVVPWPAGGPSDFVARQIQNDFARALGQPLVVENIGGVGGALGVQKMLAGTDGHTLLLGSPLELIIPPLTLATVKYKPQDLRLVAQLVKAPMVLLARKDLGADTLDELLALAAKARDAKAKPLAMANTGPGSMFHLVGEQFARQLGVELVHVPYRGSAPAMGDLMGGQVDLMFSVYAGPIPATVAEGKLKAIGLTTSKPLAAAPKLAALAAHPRLPGFEFDSWAGIQVPRQTPRRSMPAAWSRRRLR